MITVEDLNEIRKNLPVLIAIKGKNDKEVPVLIVRDEKEKERRFRLNEDYVVISLTELEKAIKDCDTIECQRKKAIEVVKENYLTKRAIKKVANEFGGKILKVEFYGENRKEEKEEKKERAIKPLF